MSTTTRLAGAGDGTVPGTNGHPRPVRVGPARRRRWARAGTGVAVALACGLIFALLYGSAGARHPVLAVTRAVSVGETIGASDLTTVRIPTSAGLAPVPAQDAADVLGRRAAVDLVPGTLLTAGDLASGPLLKPGQASVGLDLKASEVPGDLTPGTTVMVVLVPGSNGPASASQSPTVLVDNATVLTVVLPSASSGAANTQVTLAVPAPFAAQVAGAAAAGQIALVGLGPGSGS